MNHVTVKAAAVATDLGEFTAVAAAWTVDRQGDQIVPGAFRHTIERWRGSGKLLPLHYNHGTAADHIIGHVRPDTMVETDEGLVVEGQLDLEGSDLAREAWRSVKNGVMSLSFGFVATDSIMRDDGVQELREIDLYEISLVAAPANFDTHILQTKAATDGFDTLRAQARDELHRLLTAPDSGDTDTGEKAIATKSSAPIQVATFEVG